MPKTTLIIQAKSLFDAVGRGHQEGASVWIAGERIQAVYGREAPPVPPDVPVLNFPNGCILPGFIDAHVHLMYGTAHRTGWGPRNYDYVNEEDSASLMLLRSVRNGYQHLLESGVTTMRDCGARDRVTLDLKQGISANLFHGFPRVIACGRSLSETGGHMYGTGQEADGVDGCRAAARQLIKEGADFIKVMASGGTYNTDDRRVTYTPEELHVLVDEAHRHGRHAAAHAMAAESIGPVLDAGFDTIEHYTFIQRDNTRRFDVKLGARMIESEIWLSPTINTGYRRLESLRQWAQERVLTPAEEDKMAYSAWKQEGQLAITGRLYEMGARRFLAGTDATADFGDYAINLELLAEAGLSNTDVLLAATRNCAEAFDLLDEIGTLEAGKLADITIVEGDPLQDIKATGRVVQVIKAGYAPPMAATSFFPHGGGAAQVQVERRPPARFVPLDEDDGS